MKKIMSKILVCILVLGCLTTCKRSIVKYPINLHGEWACNHGSCTYMLFKIDENGNGEYGPSKCCKGCNMLLKGKVKFTNDYLYIEGTKLRFVNKPELIENDSLDISYKPYEFLKYKKVRVYAKMTIRESQLYGGNTYTLYKIR